MKQLITILFLLIMAGQLTGMYYSKFVGFEVSQDLDDKKDKAGKEGKKEYKEYFSRYSSYGYMVLINKKSFILSPVAIIPSPAIDHHTPPPDLAIVI